MSAEEDERQEREARRRIELAQRAGELGRLLGKTLPFPRLRVPRWVLSRMSKPPEPVQGYGCIVMIDALAYKGMWETEDPRDVVLRLHELQRGLDWVYRGARALLFATRRGNAPGVPRFRAVSDTVVLVVPAFSGTADGLAPALGIAALGTSLLQMYGAASDPRFVYRGALAVGQFTASQTGDYFLGPAVDRAARAMDAPAGAFVALAPSDEATAAKQALQSLLNSSAPELLRGFSGGQRRAMERFVFGLTNLLIDYDVPVRGKNGYLTHETAVVNPFSWAPMPEDQERQSAAIARAFERRGGPKSDHQRSIVEHTQAFLAEVRSRYPGID